MLLLIGFWIYSARGMVNTTWKFINIFGKEDKQLISGMSISQNENINPSFVNRTITPEENTVEQMVFATLNAFPTITPYPTKEQEIITELQPTLIPDHNNKSGFRPTVFPDLTIAGPEIMAPILKKSYALGQHYREDPNYKIVPGKYSFYWPEYGGINCDIVNGEEECDYMASGLPVDQHIGTAWACDKSIPFFTVIYIEELNIWGQCLDRGGAIVQDKDGRFWFDQLIKQPMLNWSENITIRVYGWK